MLIDILVANLIVCSIIVLDAKRLARASAEGQFSDARLRTYIPFAAGFGGLVLPFYFYASRRRATALLAGIGIALAVGPVALLVSTLVKVVLALIAPALGATPAL